MFAMFDDVRGCSSCLGSHGVVSQCPYLLPSISKLHLRPNMARGKATPVIIGVGDVKNKSSRIEDALEPMELMLQATLLCLKDTKLSPSAQQDLQANIDSIDVVKNWTWNYHDLPGVLGEKLGVQLRHKLVSTHGGHSPALLFDHTARRIASRKCKVAVVTGGEALASCTHHVLFARLTRC